jgi:hypothetical protein
VIGIDHYAEVAPLSGCVADAEAVAAVLARHHDGSPNFDVRALCSSDEHPVIRVDVLAQIRELLAHETDVALLFFAGHGTENDLGGYLVTSDATEYQDGIPMMDVLRLATESPAHEVVVVLDCCKAGGFGAVPAIGDQAFMREGLSVLTAARSTQGAAETGGRGAFSALVCSALEGGAADTLGKVSVASVYAYVEEALGPWEQRPLMKAHVSKLIALRFAQPSVAPQDLRELVDWFPTVDYDFPLDRSYEPTEEPADEERERIFGRLQKMRAAKLVEPVGEEHMYYAALNERSCRLSPLGQLYWRLVTAGRI